MSGKFRFRNPKFHPATTVSTVRNARKKGNLESNRLRGRDRERERERERGETRAEGQGRRLVGDTSHAIHRYGVQVRFGIRLVRQKHAGQVRQQGRVARNLFVFPHAWSPNTLTHSRTPLLRIPATEKPKRSPRSSLLGKRTPHPIGHGRSLESSPLSQTPARPGVDHSLQEDRLSRWRIRNVCPSGPAGITCALPVQMRI